MIPDFVIDSELFLLFSPMNNNFDRIKHYFRGEILYEEDEEIIREAKCFLEVLEKVKSSKCAIARNEPIKKEYLKIIETYDNTLKRKFITMIATRSCWHHNNETFTNDHKETFKGTILEGKTHYIDAASQCEDYRVIVSTKKYTDEYLIHENKLLEFEVDCEHVCKLKNSLEENNTSKFSGTGDSNKIGNKSENKKTLLSNMNRFLILQPTAAGVGINVNELIKSHSENRENNDPI